MIKKLLPAVVLSMFSINCFSQDSIILKGPFQPHTKYENNALQVTSMEMKAEGDSAVIAEANRRNAFAPAIQKDTFRSNALITVGKLNKSGKYPIVTEIHPLNKNILKGLKIIIYGSMQKDSAPQADSMDFEPKTKEFALQKEQMFQFFKGILNYMPPPDFYFHIGDTISTTVIVPSYLFGIRLNYIIHNLYKLTNIEKGLAYFNLKYTITLDIPQRQQAIISAKGSGTGEGSFTYDMKNKYFPLTESNMLIKAVTQFYNPSENKYIKLNMKEQVHSVIQNKKVRKFKKE